MNRLLSVMLLHLILIAWTPARAGSGAAASGPAWMRVEATILPLRENTVHDGAILGYARNGDVLAIEKEGRNWVKLRANDTLAGWAPKSLLSPSGPPVHWDTGKVKGALAIAASLGLLVFLVLAVRLHLTRRAENLDLSRQALADARRRLQNKIQLLFRSEPRIPSHLVMDEVDLPEFLRNIGYVANLERDPERFLASCKAFKPNLILAAAEFRDKVEALVETDALLINTPVVYLLSDKASLADNGRIRAHLEPNASDRELGEAISLCLKRSPEKIRYSVKPVAMKGEIRGGTLVELLHFLATVRRSGRLLAASGGVRGEVILRQGEIVRAAFGDLTGARAAEQVLNLAAGNFEFHEQDVAAAAETLNTQKLLLDWARTRDERDHHPGP